MSRYIQSIIFVIFLIFVGCAQKETPSAAIGSKSFESEDELILRALDYQQNDEIEKALDLYKTLYEKSGKIHYIIEAAKRSLATNNDAATKTFLQIATKHNANNPELKRMWIGYFIHTQQYENAKNEILDLLKIEKSAQNLTMAGSVYIQSKEYDLALKYFESAYQIEQSDFMILRITDLMYDYLERKDDAISYLETHTRLKGCSRETCFKLLEIYGKEKNINGIIATYKKLYETFRDEQFAKKVVELLQYTKDRQGAIAFLKKSGYNQELLLEIYLSIKDFASAYETASKLYDTTNNRDYLAKMAIYEYEKNKDNLSPEILASISQKFETALLKLHTAMYYNYYGYLLIDHDLDIEKGLGLVKAALLQEPNSPFYLDSLAWGYYKQKRCKEALEIMEQVIKSTPDEPEVTMHYEKIQKCIKESL